MNWSKGENKLILVFLCINLILFWANYRNNSKAYVLKDSQVEDIVNVLQKNNIIVDSNIPVNYMPMKKLTVLPYQINGKDREDLVKNILGSLEGVKVSIESVINSDLKPKRVYRKDNEQVSFDGESIIYTNGDIKRIDKEQITSKGAIFLGDNNLNQAKKLSEKWLIKLKETHKDKYMQIYQEDEFINVIYYDKYDGIPVFDSYIKFIITPFGISEVKIHRAEIGETIGSSTQIYSADQICFYLMREISRDRPIHINDIVIGYALENPKGTHLIAEEALPFYQVMIEGGKFYYINAYNGEIR